MTTETPAGAVKWKVSSGTATLGCSPVKVNRVSAPSISSISMPVMLPSAVTVSVRPRDALLLSFGLAREVEAAVRRGGRGQVVHLLFELGVAEQKAQRRAQIVQLFGGDALHLRVAARVEPGELAIEQKQLAGGRTVIPLHAAWLQQQQRAALGRA